MGFVGYGHTSNLGSGPVWKFLFASRDRQLSANGRTSVFACEENLAESIYDVQSNECLLICCFDGRRERQGQATTIVQNNAFRLLLRTMIKGRKIRNGMVSVRVGLATCIVVGRRRETRSRMHETLLEKQNQKVRSTLQLRNQSRN